MIDEHNLFVSLGNFNSDAAIDAEFNTLVGLATTVRDETIAADAIKIAADAAAVAAIWSFGLGMAAFATLEVTATIMQAVISSKSKDLNEKLKTVDTDIASQINPSVSKYVAAYKKNNDIVAAKQAKGMDGQTCRSILLQFMAQIESTGGTLDVPTFKKYANSARKLYESQEINDVYDALDKLNMSAKSDEDVKKCIDSLKGFTFGGGTALTIVRYTSVGIMANRLNVATKKLAQYNEIAEFVGAETETSLFKMMDCWGKFFAGIAVVASVADAILEILDIVEVVEQTKKMVDDLNGRIKTSYKSYFDGIKQAAQLYNEAAKKKTG
ncbi:hypothetical protein SBRCBS47491_009580 [Sporothrix bragantina]|uniref:Uncharacterized protein n=1 Tax=Sporothrix bragantina TaxID=671064 RepID=A0ABP0CYK5_9PEZI